MALNLLANPSFEGAPWGTPPPSWLAVGTAGATAASQADLGVFEQTHDALLTVASTTDFVRLIQAATIPAGTSNFLVLYAIRAPDPGANGRARARILYFDAAHAQLSYEIVQTVAAGHLGNTTWMQHVYVSGTIPPTAVKAQLELTLGGEAGNLGNVVYDNAALIPLT